jgi:hypothetical protein
MYFASCLMTILSLVGVASFNFVLQNFDLEPDISTALKWLTLTSAGSLVFAVQLGVQTLPTLLSGELDPLVLLANIIRLDLKVGQRLKLQRPYF